MPKPMQVSTLRTEAQFKKDWSKAAKRAKESKSEYARKAIAHRIELDQIAPEQEKKDGN